MNIDTLELPSNKRFGFFFAGLSLAGGCYCWFNESINATYILLLVAAAFSIISLLKADLLFPANRLWMRFGLFLGSIINPIILGIIFFLLFAPTAFTMRLFKRDELKLHFRKKNSYWINRSVPINPDSFKNQF